MKQRTYKATGINLKAIPMGESDRMLTVLTKEHGLVRAIAPGARKHKSRLAGRSGLFVVNDLLFTRGKSIDKLIQADTRQSFPGLSKDLAKLTASQYIAEIVLSQAISDHPQEALFALLLEHLTRLETASKSSILACLAQATFHLLALAGVAPEVFNCCLTRTAISPDITNPQWQVGFSVSLGGVVDPAEIERIEKSRLAEAKIQIDEHRQQRENTQPLSLSSSSEPADLSSAQASPTAAESAATYPSKSTPRYPANLSRTIQREVARELGVVTYLTAAEVALMQQLSKPSLVLTADPSRGSQIGLESGRIGSDALTAASAPSGLATSGLPTGLSEAGPHHLWRRIEQALRQYAQYQLDRPIRSAALIDTCFNVPTHASPA